MRIFLESNKYIDFEHPAVADLAGHLAIGASSDVEITRRMFEFVRDEIRHCWDYRRDGPPACTASEALLQGSGWCYAKSHLLAALLRANRVPAGLCYQRLSVGEFGPPYCLHGLNAVFLNDFGWLRVDARGNKPGVNAHFAPPYENLAFSLRDPGECDLREIWPSPRAEIIRALEESDSDEAVFKRLPDVTLLPIAKMTG